VSDFTVVTALYNIGRENIDGRKWDEYLSWFSKTLKINCHMIVFVPSELKEFVETHRERLKTDIIVQELNETPYYHLSPKIADIVKDAEYNKKMNDSHRIECSSSLYTCIQYSKFKWMKKAASMYENNHFIWMDAGLSRFFDDLNITAKYPGPNGASLMMQQKGKIISQLFCNSYPDLFSAEEISKEYFWDNRSYVMGGMFAGNKSAIEKIDELTEDIIANDMVANGLINNEQIALGYLVKKHGNLFAVFVNQGTHMGHRNYELINIIGS